MKYNLPRCGIVVVLVDVEGRQRIVISDKIRMTPFNAIVKNGHEYAFAGESGQPGLLHIHVQPVAAVQVPHLRPSGKETSISVLIRQKAIFFLKTYFRRIDVIFLIEFLQKRVLLRHDYPFFILRY